MTDEAKARCTAERKDGTPCKNWALEGTDPALCFFHGGRRQLGPPKPKVPREPVPAEEIVPVEVPGSNGKGRGNVREVLKRTSDDHAPEIVQVLLKATRAEREVWVTCRGCGVRTQTRVADHRAAVDAVDRLITLGYGRVKEQAPEREGDDRESAFAVMLRYLTRQEFQNLMVRMSADHPSLAERLERWEAERRHDEGFEAIRQRWLKAHPGKTGIDLACAIRERGYIGEDTEGRSVYVYPTDTEAEKRAKRESLAVPPPLAELDALGPRRSESRAGSSGYADPSSCPNTSKCGLPAVTRCGRWSG